MDNINVKKDTVNKKEKIPATVRNIVWNTYIGPNKKKGNCLCCSQEDISYANFHCGHIISEKKGGKVTIDNLRPICSHCNTSIGTQNMEEFIEKYGIKKNPNWNGIKVCGTINNDELIDIISSDGDDVLYEEKYGESSSESSSSENDKMPKKIIQSENYLSKKLTYSKIELKSDASKPLVCKKNIDTIIDSEIYDSAFEMICVICPGVFKIGKINESHIDLLRLKKCKCIMSDNIHEKENAFLNIFKYGKYYEIRFGCYRYCNKEFKTYYIGIISVVNKKIVEIDSSFLG